MVGKARQKVGQALTEALGRQERGRGGASYRAQSGRQGNKYRVKGLSRLGPVNLSG